MPSICISLIHILTKYFCHPSGLECQKPKRQDRKEKDIEVISTGTDSPELCTPDTTPPAQTPDLSPALSNPPSPPCTPSSHRARSTCFMRQSAVDEQRGAEIQVLVEGRGIDNRRDGAHCWTADMYPNRRGSKGDSSRSTTPSLLEEDIGHMNGHEENSTSHHSWENGSSNHKPVDHNSSDKAWEHVSSNQKSWKHVSSNHKSREYMITKHREWEHIPSSHNNVDHNSSKIKTQAHTYSNHKTSGHSLSNHKTHEHLSSNHKPKEYISIHPKSQDHVSSYYNAREHVSSYRKSHEHVHFNSKPSHSCTNHTIACDSSLNDCQQPDRGSKSSTLSWTVENSSQWMPCHSQLPEKEKEKLDDYRVEMRFQPLDSNSQQPFGVECQNLQTLRQRNHEGKDWSLTQKEGSMDSVQMLDSLNVGVDLEEWPLHRDVTLSPPSSSSPITLETEGEHLNLVKANSVSKWF